MVMFSSPWRLSESKRRASHGRALGQPGELFTLPQPKSLHSGHAKPLTSWVGWGGECWFWRMCINTTQERCYVPLR